MDHINKTQKHNIDVYQVILDGAIVAEFMSEAAAVSFILANRNKMTAKQFQEKKTRAEEALKERQRKLRIKLQKHRMHVAELRCDMLFEPSVLEDVGSINTYLSKDASNLVDQSVKEQGKHNERKKGSK